jgi:hypothetical protein
MPELMPWHRLFGLSFSNDLHGLPITFEYEKDLSERQQLVEQHPSPAQCPINSSRGFLSRCGKKLLERQRKAPPADSQ